MPVTVKPEPVPSVSPDFIGRDWFFESITGWLATDGAPPVRVVVAEPGWGKSHLARELSRRFPRCIVVDGRRAGGTDREHAFWIDLATAADLVAGEPGADTLTPARILTRLRQVKPSLLVIDRAEHLSFLADTATLRNLVGGHPPLKVLLLGRSADYYEKLPSELVTIEARESQASESLGDLQRWLQAENAPSDLAVRALGNFAVARDLLRGRPERVVQRNWALVEEQLETIPPELREDALRVLCLLAESKTPLPSRLVGCFLGLSAGRTRVLLRCVQPLLRESNDRFYLYSPWLGVAVSSTLEKDLESIHANVIGYFRETFPSWDEMTDPYGWKYLLYHGDRFSRTSKRRDFSVLHWLGEGPFLRLKLQKTRSLAGVLEDLRLALTAAMEDGDLPRLVHYGFQLPRLRREVAAHGLHELADLNELKLAREYALLMNSDADRFLGLLLLAWQVSEDEGDILVERLLLDQAAIPLAELPDEAIPLLVNVVADLLRVLPSRQDDLLDLLTRTESTLRQTVTFFTLALVEHLNPAVRRIAIERGLELSRSLSEEDREALLPVLGRSLRRHHHADLAELVDGHRSPDPVGKIADKEQFVAELAGVSMAAQHGRGPERLVALGERLLAAAGEDQVLPEWAGEELVILAQAIVNLAGDFDKAQALQGLGKLVALAPPSPITMRAFESLTGQALDIETRALRARVAADLGVSLYRHREFVRSNDLFSKAAQAAFEVEPRGERALTLLAVAGSVANTAHPARARDIAFNALEAFDARSELPLDYQSRAAIKMGVLSTISAERLLDNMRQNAEEVRRTGGLDPRLKALALGTLAEGSQKLGAAEWSRQLLDQALASARVMTPGLEQCATLATLALREYEARETGRMEQVLQEAMESLHTETSIPVRVEGLLAIAATRLDARDSKAQPILRTVYNELEKASVADLLGCRSLARFVALTRRCNLVEWAERLLERARTGLSEVTESRDAALINLIELEVAFQAFDAALGHWQGIVGVRARARAQADLAVGMVRYRPEQSLSLLASIPIQDERLPAIGRAAFELARELRPSHRAQVQRTLQQLTLLAVEDEGTADLVLSRWLSECHDVAKLDQTARKMLWVSEDPPHTPKAVHFKSI